MKDKIAKVKESAKKPISKLSRKKSDEIESAKLPYITNDTVAEHREEVLAGARKYIYPLQHSKHKIVWLSVAIFVITFIVFFAYSILSLYRFQNTSTFTYRITQIIPFPAARAEGKFVSYESYLFELRRLMHYYEHQQKLNFSTPEGQEQLNELKKQAMDKVVNDAYVKHIAEKNKVSVSMQDVDKAIDDKIKQDRLGNDDKMLGDVLRDYWGWSVNDFKRSLRQEILATKVANKLDTEARSKADSALSELRSGADFAEIVNKYSNDDLTKPAGGDYGAEISATSRDIPSQTIDAIFSQQPGQFSAVLDTDSSLEIVKTLSLENGKARAAHIQINIKSIQEYIEAARKASPPDTYVKL